MQGFETRSRVGSVAFESRDAVARRFVQQVGAGELPVVRRRVSVLVVRLTPSWKAPVEVAPSPIEVTPTTPVSPRNLRA
jgi:hypothetical protein